MVCLNNHYLISNYSSLSAPSVTVESSHSKNDERLHLFLNNFPEEVSSELSKMHMYLYAETDSLEVNFSIKHSKQLKKFHQIIFSFSMSNLIRTAHTFLQFPRHLKASSMRLPSA